MNEHLLLVDDDEALAQLVQLLLERAGYNVNAANNGESCLALAKETPPDLVLLDILMPDMDGWHVYEALRRITDSPVLFLTALGDEHNITYGLGLGADDYIVKPFGYKELVTRVKAALSRARRARGEQTIFQTGNLWVNLDTHEVKVDNRIVSLTPTEFRLLSALIQDAGRTVNHDTLLRRVWGAEYSNRRDYLKLYIWYLRQKIEVDPREPRRIVSEIGQGYRLSIEAPLLKEQKTLINLRLEVALLRDQVRDINSKQIKKEENSPKSEGVVSLTDLNRLVSGIMHDLRGGLGLIQSAADFVLSEHDDPTDLLLTSLQTVNSRAELCDIVIRNLMSLGEYSNLNPAEVDPKNVIARAFSLLKHKLANVQFSVAGNSQMPAIIAEEPQMIQIFVNIMRNAGEAMPNGGELSITAEEKDKLLCIKFTDTGQGIESSNVARVFELGFSTRSRRFGSELYITKSIVENHNGHIEIESEAGHQTTVSVFLPLLATNTSENIDAERISLETETGKLLLQRENLRRHIKRSKGLGEITAISLSDLQRLVTGIAQDLQNNLNVIRNTVGFLLDDADENGPIAPDLRKIAYSVEFCEIVTRNLMALGGEDIYQPIKVNVEEVAREVFFMLERKFVDTELIVDVPPDTPPLIIDIGHAKQLFMNLIKNAGEAMPDGGTLTVKARHNSQTLRIEVSDTGCGISTEHQARLFKELFTTKDKGYGLGLLIVYSIIERYKGTIHVKSKREEGTTFIIDLPVE